MIPPSQWKGEGGFSVYNIIQNSTFVKKQVILW